MSDLGLSLLTSDPTQRLYQRIAQLDGRISALEGHRDISFAPFSISGAGSVSFTWNGGTLWLLVGGTVFNNNTAGNLYNVGANIRLAATGALVYNESVSVNYLQSGTLPTRALQITGMNRGANSLTVAINGNAAPVLNGLLVEWPQ